MDIKTTRNGITSAVVKSARSKNIGVLYENTNISSEVADTIRICRYSDSINELDSIDITMDDREDMWLYWWKPLKGDSISLQLNLNNWERDDVVVNHKIGDYFVDNIGYSGPTSTVNIKAVSVDLRSPILDSIKNKVWENITFKKIAEEICKSAGLVISYNVEIQREYERVEQREQSDFYFLKNLADELEINVKLYNGKLVLWEESLMEKQAVSAVIKRGEVASYNFSLSDTDNYKECEVRYHDYKKNKVVTAKYTLEKQKNYKYDNERKLLIIQNKSPKGKTIDEKQKNLKKIAAKELKKRNNSALTANINILGRETLFYSGTVIELQDFGTMNGRYLIKSVETELKTFTCNLNIRACNYEEYENA